MGLRGNLSRMILMYCRNRVADFARWKAIFDSHGSAHPEAGLRLVHLGRSLEDPNDVFFTFEVANLESARAFATAPESQRAGQLAGVLDGEIHFVETL
jgi:hypothetical protein